MMKNFISINIARNRYRKIYFESIIYCKAAGAYCQIKTVEKDFVFSQNLKMVEKNFDIKNFIRVNRSYLVNTDHCAELKIGSKPELILCNGEVLQPNMDSIDKLMDAFRIPPPS